VDEVVQRLAGEGRADHDRIVHFPATFGQGSVYDSHPQAGNVPHGDVVAIGHGDGLAAAVDGDVSGLARRPMEDQDAPGQQAEGRQVGLIERVAVGDAGAQQQQRRAVVRQVDGQPAAVRQRDGGFGHVVVAAVGDHHDGGAFAGAPVHRGMPDRRRRRHGRRGRQDVAQRAVGQVDQPQQAVLVGQGTALGDGGVVVVAGGHVRVVAADGPPAAEAEVGAAVVHVVVDLAAGPGQFHCPPCDVAGVPAGVLAAPPVEPPAPVLGGQQRFVRLQRAKPFDLLDGAAVPVEAFDGVGHEWLGHVVAGEDGHVDARPPVVVRDVVEIVHPLGHGRDEVLVLVLDRHDVAATGDLQLGQAGQQLAEVLVVVVGIDGVGASQVDVLLGAQPGGEAAEVPLGADVGPRADDHVQPEVRRLLDELDDVVVAGEIPLPFVAFVTVPRHVRLDAVEPAGLRLGQAVAPQLAGHAEIVDGTADQPHPVPVDQETPVVIRHGGHRVTPRAAKFTCKESAGSV